MTKKGYSTGTWFSSCLFLEPKSNRIPITLCFWTVRSIHRTEKGTWRWLTAAHAPVTTPKIEPKPPWNCRWTNTATMRWTWFVGWRDYIYSTLLIEGYVRVYTALMTIAYYSCLSIGWNPCSDVARFGHIVFNQHLYTVHSVHWGHLGWTLLALEGWRQRSQLRRCPLFLLICSRPDWIDTRPPRRQKRRGEPRGNVFPEADRGSKSADPWSYSCSFWLFSVNFKNHQLPTSSNIVAIPFETKGNVFGPQVAYLSDCTAFWISFSRS